ncbi:MAG TPA: DUF3027 domain-containing protein [Jatrophihabitans sp.]|nr:DUF3027 domain-containing protein [Jatrophihabitans sp.]
MNATTDPQPTSSQPVDEVLAAAVPQARQAAVEMAGADVGEHLSVRSEGELMATHAFSASLPGYRGWYWAVTMVRAPGREPTVAEVVLLPGEAALLAPEWVPWSERLQPGDLSPGDLLPTAPDDPRLVPGYLASDDPQVEEVAFEFGLGRVRVLSRYGRLEAADRWQAGDYGPDAPMAKLAPAPCGTCGFLVPLGGSLRAGFGVCANEIAAADGRVVSIEFGCGAHSETVAEPAVDELGEVYEDELFDIEASDSEPVDSAQPAPELGEQAGVEGELPPVQPIDRTDATDAGQLDGEPATGQLGDSDPIELDQPAVVEGGVEQPPPGDAG